MTHTFKPGDRIRRIASPTPGLRKIGDICTVVGRGPEHSDLTSAIAATLPVLLADAAQGLLFPLKPQTVWYMWQAVKDDVKARGGDIEDVTIHTLRHTCLTRLARRITIQKVSLWAGHSSIEITAKRYMHLDGQDLLEARSVLE